MTKTSILRLLTAVASVASGVAASDLTGVINIVPDSVSAVMLWILPVALATKEVAVVAGDYLDDGKRNDSFRG